MLSTKAAGVLGPHPGSPLGLLKPHSSAPSRWRGEIKHRLTRSLNAAGNDGQQNSHAASNDWAPITSKLVGLASVPFSFLVLPQVITNCANLASGNAVALSVISWQVNEPNTSDSNT